MYVPIALPQHLKKTVRSWKNVALQERERGIKQDNTGKHVIVTQTVFS